MGSLSLVTHNLHAALPMPLWLRECGGWIPGMGMGASALNWHRAFLGAAPPCRQPWVGEGCHVLPAVLRGMLCLEGLSRQAGFFWCWCCSPAKNIHVPCTRGGLDPGAGLCRQAALFPPFPAKTHLFGACHARPCFAALQAEAAVIFQHVLLRGVVGPTRQLRSLFHVFTCLGEVHPCFVGSLLGCTNSVRQNHEQVLVQPG